MGLLSDHADEVRDLREQVSALLAGLRLISRRGREMVVAATGGLKPRGLWAVSLADEAIVASGADIIPETPKPQPPKIWPQITKPGRVEDATDRPLPTLRGRLMTAVCPFADLEHVEDLIYFDGPLLSLFKFPETPLHAESVVYLAYWVDADKQYNRWMLMSVKYIYVQNLKDRLTPLDAVITAACDDQYVNFIDVDSEGRACYSTTVNLPDIPLLYRPGEGAMLPE